MDEQVKATERVVQLLRKRDASLLSKFGLSYKKNWSELKLEPSGTAIAAFVELYDVEIARTESELGALLSDGSGADDDGGSLNLLLDLGVDHSIYLLSSLISKLLKLTQTKVLADAISSALTKIVSRLSAYLTKYVSVPSGGFSRSFTHSMSLKSVSSTGWDASPSKGVAAATQVEHPQAA